MELEQLRKNILEGLEEIRNKIEKQIKETKGAKTLKELLMLMVNKITETKK